MRELGQGRRITFGVALAVIAALSLGISQQRQHAGTENKAQRHILYYVDPMHPTYRSDKPGIAPDCGMRLEPVFAEVDNSRNKLAPQVAVAANPIRVEAPMQKAFGIRSVPVEKRVVSRTLQVVGRVVPEDSKIFTINSGVDGFIRETFNDSVGSFVTKDQKLASYYAPDFITAASGFLAANERVPGSVTSEGARSIQNYSDRLRNLGMSDVQIHHIAEVRQLPESIDIVSPTNGVILARNISPGQHFVHETQFYQVADLSHVWVVAELDQQDESYWRPGSTAYVSVRGEGIKHPAQVTGSLPQNDANGSTVQCRLELSNPKYHLRPQMVVDIGLTVDLAPAITVPVEALIDSGSRTQVFVAQEGGIMQPREVETGWRTNDLVEIKKGLQPGERVVAAGAFLIDSESRLKSSALLAHAGPDKPTAER